MEQPVQQPKIDLNNTTSLKNGKKGDLFEQGDHELLLNNKSVYYSLLRNEEK